MTGPDDRNGAPASPGPGASGLQAAEPEIDLTGLLHAMSGTGASQEQRFSAIERLRQAFRDAVFAATRTSSAPAARRFCVIRGIVDDVDHLRAVLSGPSPAPLSFAELGSMEERLIQAVQWTSAKLAPWCPIKFEFGKQRDAMIAGEH